MTAGLTILVLVAGALGCVASGFSISAFFRWLGAGEEDRLARSERISDSCGVGHTTGRDSRLSSPIGAVGAIPPVGGVPEVTRGSALIAFVHRHGLVGLAEQVAVASDDDLRAAAAATYGRSGLAAELHETVVEELASRATFELARAGVRRG